MKEHSTLPRSKELEQHLQMQFSVIIQNIPFCEGVLPLGRGSNQCSLSPANRAPLTNSLNRRLPTKAREPNQDEGQPNSKS